MSGYRHRAITVVAVVVCQIGACTSIPHERPNVLLVCIDTLRADALGSYGADLDASPSLDRIARRGVVFEAAYSTASWTKPSVPSLLTGLLPFDHGVLQAGHSGSDVLDDSIVTLAELLQGAGYATGAFVENAHLIDRYSGLAQGFDTYVEEAGTALGVTDRFFSWLESGVRKPFFAYVHVLDTHLPYTPNAGAFDDPADTARFAEWGMDGSGWKLVRRALEDGTAKLSAKDTARLRRWYQAEVRWTDAVLGRTFELLEARGLLENTVLIVTSDHGEGFLEHGSIDHGYGPYAELVHVPLLVAGPVVGTGGRREQAHVSLIDVVPTIAEAAGIAPPEGLPGRSLFDPESARVVMTEEMRGDRHITSVRDAEYTYIRTVTGDRGTRTIRLPADLKPGTRVRMRGAVVEAAWLVDYVKKLDGTDNDLELSGVLWVPKPGAPPYLLGHEIVFGNGSPEPPPMLREAGAVWAKADLDVRSEGLTVSEIEAIPAGADREIEVEGTITDVAILSAEYVRLQLGRIVAFVHRDARWKDFNSGDSRIVEFPALAQERIHEELYTRSLDPGELRNIADESPGILGGLRSFADAAHTQRQPLRAPTSRLDAATRERLRALGYLD